MSIHQDEDHLTLANAGVEDSIDVDEAFPIDPSLGFENANDDTSGSPKLDSIGHVTQAEIDQATADAIASSLNAAAAHQQQQQQQLLLLQGQGESNDDARIDDQYLVSDVKVNKRKAEDDIAGESQGSGRASSPTINPTTHLAPFSRPNRDENTPHPEIIQFTNRAEFEMWFAGEDSWCHFVQRRVTTPEKRSEERARARQKAHEKALAAMPPEEAANTPPPKRRRRGRTSPVVEKITYTCHHAGSYSSKHSDLLPKSKLRLNTKTSVKCGCLARIVMNEVEGGDVRVTYYWQHQGHDPYAEGEHDTGRLPKIIDDWIVSQIQAGKGPEDIRRLLQMTPEEKDALLQSAAADPTSVPPDMPPPLAFNLKIKYPDIYNRYRKYKGPIRELKPGKSRRAKRETEGQASVSGAGTPTSETGEQGNAEAGPSGTSSASAVGIHLNASLGPGAGADGAIEGVDEAAGVIVDDVDFINRGSNGSHHAGASLVSVEQSGVDGHFDPHASFPGQEQGPGHHFDVSDGQFEHDGESYDASHLAAAAAAAVQAHAQAQAEAAQAGVNGHPQAQDHIEDQGHDGHHSQAHEAYGDGHEVDNVPVEMKEELARIANELTGWRGDGA